MKLKTTLSKLRHDGYITDAEYAIIINALNKSATQPCEDCISREKVFEQISCWVNSGEYRYTNATYYLTRRIQGISSVTPSRPKGHWISHREHCENLGLKPSGLGAYEWCSNCDCGIDVKEFHRNYYNFCPNCGAKMTESEGEK